MRMNLPFTRQFLRQLGEVAHAVNRNGSSAGAKTLPIMEQAIQKVASPSVTLLSSSDRRITTRVGPNYQLQSRLFTTCMLQHQQASSLREGLKGLSRQMPSHRRQLFPRDNSKCLPLVAALTTTSETVVGTVADSLKDSQHPLDIEDDTVIQPLEFPEADEAVVVLKSTNLNLPPGTKSRVKTAEFVKSSADISQCPKDGRPEFAVIGRSNVGKSSLINMLVSRKELAQTSKKPGKTQLINHFIINNSWYLVDLPGYGFAKAPKGKRIEWNEFTKTFFLQRETLVSVLLLVDASIPPQQIDLECADWFGRNKIPATIIFTKCDRRKKQKNGGKPPQENIAAFQDALKEYYDEMPPWIMTSAVTRMGKDDVLAHMAQLRDYWKN